MHKHKHNHNHGVSYKNIKLAFLLNLLFSIIEFFGAIFTNSVSILSDSIHDFGDSISIGVSLILEKISTKKSDNKYTYGYLRYSLIGALFTSMMLLIGAFIVLYRSIPLLKNPNIINHDVMIIFAIFGSIINGYAAYRTSKGKNKNEKAISLHMLEDVLGWVAVLIGGIIIKFTGLYIIDPILSILIALYILYHVYDNIKDVFYVFMDRVPNDINIDELKKHLEDEFKEIKNVHHIHVWTVDGINNYLTAHILLNKELNETKIIKLKKNIKHELSHYSINHVTLEIEYYNEECDSFDC